MKTVIRTFTGKEVNPLDLRLADIDVYDIAHALALCNRFAGHTAYPISVAQHAVYVSRLLSGTGFEREGLHHDDAEAYLGDVTKWLKATDAMRGYRAAEANAATVISIVFGLHYPKADPTVDWADRVMVRFEGLAGFGPSFAIDHPAYPPLTEDEFRKVGQWEPWPWRRAEAEFLETHFALLSGHVVFA